jgi:transposase
MVQPPTAQEAVPLGRDIPPADGPQTPASVRTLVVTLLQRLEAVAARLTQDSTTSQRPPATDSPYQKARKPAGDVPPRPAGGQPGHPGHRQALWAPTETQVLTPPQCACGHTVLTGTRAYHPHHVIELPALQMDGTHLVLQEAWGPLWAQGTKAQGPPEHTAGSGPRLTALVGDIAGTHGTGRRTIQTLCASVLQVPLSLGAIQQMLDRVTYAMEPPYQAIACQARQAPVNYIDATPWCLPNTLHWVWGMASKTAACSMLHPRRS